MAMQRQVPTIAIFVMKDSAYHYKVYIRRVEANVAADASRQEKVASLAQQFTREMESVLKAYPEQWFNYFEYWKNE